MLGLHFRLLALFAVLLLPTAARASDPPRRPFDEVYVGTGPDAGTTIVADRNVVITRSSEPGVIEDIVIGSTLAANGRPTAAGMIRRFKDGSKTAKLVLENATGNLERYARDPAGKWTKNDVPAEPSESRLLELYVKDMLGIAKEMQISAAKSAVEVGSDSGRSTVVPKSVDPAVTKDCEDCPEMVPAAIEVDGKQRRLQVARYELTWKEYLAALDETSCSVPQNHDGPVDLRMKDMRDNFPMTSLKLDEFDCYLEWLRKKTGKPYRLPTEAEWIAIAKIATGKTSVTLKDIPPDKAYLRGNWHSENIGHDDPRRPVEGRSVWRVGQFPPDKLGLFDLFGNAEEATSDRVIDKDYALTPQSEYARESVVVKGGSGSSKDMAFDFINSFSYFRLHRMDGIVGFRLVVDQALN